MTDQLPISQNDKNYCTFLYLSPLLGLVIPFGSILAPVVMWLIKKEESATIDQVGKEVVNFSITLTIAFVATWVLIFVLIGFVLMAGVAIVAIVYSIQAAMKASKGEFYRYPYIFRFIS